VNYLIDINTISEVRKGKVCDPHVAAWYRFIEDENVYLSVLVLGEIRKGIERARFDPLPQHCA
jgi:predicted nucleic acid-binding protein